jgi:hypothetical protein
MPPTQTESTGTSQEAARRFTLAWYASKNSTESAPCREYAARLSKAGMNVRLIEYPDAHHLFDGPVVREPVQLPASYNVPELPVR